MNQNSYTNGHNCKMCMPYFSTNETDSQYTVEKTLPILKSLVPLVTECLQGSFIGLWPLSPKEKYSFDTSSKRLGWVKGWVQIRLLTVSVA